MSEICESLRCGQKDDDIKLRGGKMSQVLAGIDAVRKEDSIDMLERFLVISRCRKLGYMESAKWISKNPRAYARLIIEGELPPLAKKSV